MRAEDFDYSHLRRVVKTPEGRGFLRWFEHFGTYTVVTLETPTGVIEVDVMKTDPVEVIS